MIYTQLLTLLSGATDAGTRITAQIADDQPVHPYIVYQRISANSENVMSGATGLINTRLQLDCFADTYVAAQALAKQVDDLMSGWTVQNVSNPAVDAYEPDVRLHRVILDYSVWHT